MWICFLWYGGEGLAYEQDPEVQPGHRLSTAEELIVVVGTHALDSFSVLSFQLKAQPKTENE